jgi:F0F1-type ATP synthase gamma subunit
MKYIKTFESFEIVNEEENILHKAMGFFGAYNNETRKSAEKSISELSEKTPDSLIVTMFNKLKEAYDANEGLTFEATKSGGFDIPETTEVTKEEVKKLFENVCSLIHLNEANAWALAAKDGKISAIQTKSYSATTHGFGSGVRGH